LLPENTVEVDLAAAGPAPAGSLRTIRDLSDDRVLYAPRTPAITSVALPSGAVAVTIARGDEKADDIDIAVYRDGKRVAAHLPGTTAVWKDEAAKGGHCYTVETRYRVSGNVSQRARPACSWGAALTLPASSFSAVGGTMRSEYGRDFYQDWGDKGHSITVTFVARHSGEHLVQAVYSNGAGPINTGITCAVKRVTIEDLATGAVAGAGYMMMPQRADWSSWGDSSFVRGTLVAGKSYRIRVTDDVRSVNMSAFDHFRDYTGGRGGTDGAFSRVNLAALKVMTLAP